MGKQSCTGFLVDLNGHLISFNTDNLSNQLLSSYMALSSQSVNQIP